MAGGRREVVLVLLVVSATIAAASPAFAATVPETDNTVTRVDVETNGTATWEVQVRTRLTTEEDVRDYERFQERFRDNESVYLDPFRDRMRGVVRTAANETGRPMAARNFGVDTSIQAVPRQWGIVTYEFEWTHFAAHDDSALVVGDVFRGQFYLTRNDTLEVSGPDEYEVATVEPRPAETDPGVVRWFGRQTFADDRPLVRFEPETATRTDTGDASTVDSDGSDGSGNDGTDDGTDGGDTTTDESSVPAGSDLPLAVAVLGAGVLGVGVYRYYRRGGGLDLTASNSTADSGGGPVAETGEPVDSDSDGAASGRETGAGGSTEDRPTGDAGREDSGITGSGDGAAAEGDGAAAEGDGADAGADGTGDAAPGQTDFDPKPVATDPDRVEQVLSDHGGQLRQSDVVEALDWSKSKTSRVLSEMADEGTVEKLRIGRENVIRLPGEADDLIDGDE